MNPKIKELADEAGFNTKVFDESFANLLAMRLNDFSRLIVLECINTIKMGMTRDGHDTPHYKQSMKHIKDIEDKFNES